MQSKKLKKNNKIKAICFDWAGIFCTPGELFSHPRLLKKIGRTAAEIEARVKPVQDQYYRGKISNARFWKEVLKTYALKGFSRTSLNAAYLHSYTPNQKNLELPVKLKKDYQVILLSNLTDVMMKHILKRHGLKKRFHHLLFSNTLGLLKPEEKIYQELIKQLGLQPKEILFIDDSEKNVLAAKKVGIQAVHCPTPNELPACLKRKKILAD